jgi:hypothetical protein
VFKPLVPLMAVLAASCVSMPERPSRSEAAFADACRLSHYDCAGVPPPAVRVTDFGHDFGVYGAYLGGNLIWIASDIEVLAGRDYAYAILIHETVHYLQEVVGHLPRSTSLLEVCTKEEEAYLVSNRWLVERGLEVLTRNYPYDQRCDLKPVVVLE